MSFGWAGLLAVVVLGATACSSSGDSASTTKASSPAASSSSVAPAGLTGRLLFSRFDESTHTFLSTHSIRPDGTDERKIPLPSSEGGGQWSHDGADIAVSTQLPDHRISTAVISPEGVVRKTFTPPGTLNLACDVWSPDDSRLACEGWDDKDDSKRGIYTVRSSDGADVKRLTTSPRGHADIPGDYSPDGSTFVFKRAVEESDGPLLVVPVAGGKARALTTEDYEDAGRYSPDGTEILTSDHGVLVFLDATGKQVRRIDVGNGRYLFGADWSPDGKWIAYSSAFGGPHADIVISRPDGSDKHSITATPDNEITISWGNTGP